VKRQALIRHLTRHGCEFVREGARHSWWYNPELNRRSAVPRHNEISEELARKICRDLGVPPIGR
jgi:mRNA interferase HicA